MNDTKAARHYPAIDSLRAIAVLSVVFYHLDKHLVPGGFVGVDVFFVISGFVVSLSMAGIQINGFGAFTTLFYARRLLRIAPALVVCLLMTTLAANLFIPHAWLSDSNWKTGVAAFFGLSNFVLAKPGNAYFSPRAEFNPFTHTWSLAVEEQFYVLFPLLFYAFRLQAGSPLGRRIAAWALALLSLLSLACCAWWTVHSPSFAFYLIPARFWELGAGVGLFMAWKYWHPLLARANVWAIRLLAGAALLGLLACIAVANEAAFPFPWAIGPVVFTTLIIALVVARPERVLPAPLMWAPVVWVGKVSYSLYLWHWPVFVLMRWTVGVESPLMRAVAFALSLALAAVSYRWIESPIRYAPGIAAMPRWRVVVAGLAGVLATSVLSWFISINESKVSLSVTANAERWLPDSGIGAPGVAKDRCQLTFLWQPLDAGAVQTFKPEGCGDAPGRLFVAGDSHAWAYTAMLRMYAANSGHEVRIMREEGCPVFTLQRPIAQEDAACSRFAQDVVDELGRSTRRGDVLFLPSLRVPRFRDQWGGDEIRTVPDEAARQEAVTEAIALLAPLAARGVTIMVEAPKPLFKAPPFRCSDWFNAMNPICAAGFELSRAEFEQVRRPALAAISTVVGQVPKAAVWDPAAILCSAERCDAYAHGESLYFDGDHLSGLGNAALYESFRDSMHKLLP